MAKLDKNSTQNRMSESVIGSEMEIVGDIKCNGIMRVVGKLKGTISHKINDDIKTIEKLALSLRTVHNQLKSLTPKKIIVIPGRIVNIVV